MTCHETSPPAWGRRLKEYLLRVILDQPRLPARACGIKIARGNAANGFHWSAPRAGAWAAIRPSHLPPRPLRRTNGAELSTRTLPLDAFPLQEAPIKKGRLTMPLRGTSPLPAKGAGGGESAAKLPPPGGESGAKGPLFFMEHADFCRPSPPSLQKCPPLCYTDSRAERRLAPFPRNCRAHPPGARFFKKRRQ